MSKNKEEIKLLEDIQWSKSGSCPICSAFTTNGHYKECEISQLLTLLNHPDCKPEVGEFTKNARDYADGIDVSVRLMYPNPLRKRLYEACDKLDRQAKTIDSLIKDKFTKHGNGYGFLATESEAKNE